MTQELKNYATWITGAALLITAIGLIDTYANQLAGLPTIFWIWLATVCVGLFFVGRILMNKMGGKMWRK